MLSADMKVMHAEIMLRLEELGAHTGKGIKIPRESKGLVSSKVKLIKNEIKSCSSLLLLLDRVTLIGTFSCWWKLSDPNKLIS